MVVTSLYLWYLTQGTAAQQKAAVLLAGSSYGSHSEFCAELFLIALGSEYPDCRLLAEAQLAERAELNPKGREDGLYQILLQNKEDS